MGTYRIVRMGLTRFTVIRSAKGTVLVDTVPFVYRERFFHRLDRLRLSPSEIVAILLTHHHEDHTGMVASLLETNPMIRLIFHTGEEKAAPLRKKSAGSLHESKNRELFKESEPAGNFHTPSTPTARPRRGSNGVANSEGLRHRCDPIAYTRAYLRIPKRFIR